MSIIFPAEPELHAVGDIPDLPNNRPWLVSDLDGTQTKGSKKLLMEAFMLANPELGDSRVRQRVLNIFDDWRAGLKKYDPTTLVESGDGWSEMLYRAGETRANVIQVANNWYEDVGHEMLMPHAAPMMMEAEKYRLNRMLLTGAPGELALPFAAHSGIEHVFAMMAAVDSNDRYCDTEIPRDRNTGIQVVKSNICTDFNEEHAIAVGMGDRVSDSGIAIPTINKNIDNPDDVHGRFILMYPDDEVEETMQASHPQEFYHGKITVIKNKSLGETMRLFRGVLDAVLIDNNKRSLLLEIWGAERMSLEKQEAAKRRRDGLENQWL